jgi:hypothetical protein
LKDIQAHGLIGVGGMFMQNLKETGKAREAESPEITEERVKARKAKIGLMQVTVDYSWTVE